MSSLTTDDNNNSKKEEENNVNNNMTLQNNPVDMRSIHASGLNTPVKMNNNNDDEEKKNLEPTNSNNNNNNGSKQSATLVMKTDGGLYTPPIEKKLGEPVISVHNLKKEYRLPGRSDAVTALREINIHDNSEFYSIRKGEFVMIRGASGGGKTTLLNCIGLIDCPSSGKVKILNTDIDMAVAKDSFLTEIRLNKLGFVFQTFNLLATFTALENVELPMSIQGKLSKKEMKKRAIKLLTMVGLEDRLDHIPSELSGGEQQRVTIARALANDPEILLLDEPTGDLDTKNTLEIMELLLTVNQIGKKTLVMVTHNDDLECYADRILYVSDGQFVKQAINQKQVTLDYDKYVAHLKKKMHG